MFNAEIKYINDDKTQGRIYDTKVIAKTWKTLKCPSFAYNSLKLLKLNNEVIYRMLLSERSTGKTTNIILLGMCQWWNYGGEIVLIRQTEEMTSLKNTQDLFTTILDYGYIEKLTNGQYNSVRYWSRKWYVCLVDENNNIVDKGVPFMTCLSLDKSQIYKSNLSLPNSDFIIVDEFISKIYRYNEFIDLMDVISTIRRKRLSTRVYMLTNLLDKEHEYLHEFCVYDEVLPMKTGDTKIIKTPLGASVYVELVDKYNGDEKRRNNPIEKLGNALYYGFPNKNLVAITGGDWVTQSYAHIPHGLEYDLECEFFVDVHGRLLSLKVIYNDDLGYRVLVTPSTHEIEAEDIVFSKTPTRDNDIYGVGTLVNGNPYAFLWKLLLSKRGMYATNDCGSKLNAYLREFTSNRINNL